MYRCPPDVVCRLWAVHFDVVVALVGLLLVGGLIAGILWVDHRRGRR